MRIGLQLVSTSMALAAMLAATAARGDGGIAADPSTGPWGRFQGRIAYVAAPAWRSDLAAPARSGLKISGASIMGDVYLAPTPGGLRATSGLFVGSRGGLWGSPSTTSAGARFGVGGRAFSAAAAAPAVDSVSDGGATVPYLGVGWSRLPSHGGWSFSADLGLVSLAPGNAARLGRVFGGGQGLDDVVRDMRLAPVVQLGVSYSF